MELIPLGRVPRQHDPRLGANSFGTRSGRNANEAGFSDQVLTFFIVFPSCSNSLEEKGFVFR